LLIGTERGSVPQILNIPGMMMKITFKIIVKLHFYFLYGKTILSTKRQVIHNHIKCALLGRRCRELDRAGWSVQLLPEECTAYYRNENIELGK
jgi:hypothetical protein